MRRATFATVVAVLAIAPALPSAAQTKAVSIVDNAFDPEGLEVVEGTTVEWTNDGDAAHTVTADDGSFNSGTLAPGGTFSFEFTDAGTVPYFCSFHGGAGGEGMSGQIFVQAAAETQEPAEEEEETDVQEERLPKTGSRGIPGGALAFVALSLIALGCWLANYERIVRGSR